MRVHIDKFLVMSNLSRVSGRYLPNEPFASHYKKRFAMALLENEGKRPCRKVEFVLEPRKASMPSGTN